MLKLFSIFFGAKGTNQWVVLGCLVFAAFAEGIGLASLLPVFSLVGSGEIEASSSINRAFLEVFGTIGLKPDLGILFLCVVIAYSMKAVLVLAAMRYVGYAVAEVTTERRASLIDNILQANWAYFARQPVGRIANAISLEAQRCGEAYLTVALVLTGGIQMITYVLVAFFVSWQLALGCMVVGLAIGGSLWTLVRMARKAGKRQYKRARELVTHLTDALISIKPLKAMARHGQFASLFSQKIADVRIALRREVISKQLLKHIPEPILVLVLASGFYILVEIFSMPVSEVLVMAVLLERTVSRIRKMQRRFQDAVVVESAYWNVHNMIEESAQHREGSVGRSKPSLKTGCALRNVSFAFGENQVLDDISMEIPANELTVVIGHSGTGKTTLTDLLLGLYRPDAGEVLIDGVSLDSIDLEAWRDMIGYVPQDLILFHDTILANVTLRDQTLTPEMAKAALKAAGAWEFISKLPDGMETVVGERGATLSGGQRQRIAIARGLVHSPKLLILDEVTSALDKNSERAICQNIKEISKSVTVLAISHRPAWINIADAVYELGGDEDEIEEETETASVASL